MNRDYFEVVVEGHHEFIKGFVTGLLAGKGLQEETYFGDDYDIDQSLFMTIQRNPFDSFGFNEPQRSFRGQHAAEKPLSRAPCRKCQGVP